MRLRYNILWFEDDDGTYTSFNFDDVRLHLGTSGFEAKIHRMTGEENIDETIGRAQKSDFIVMDFGLEGQQQGDELIERIRGCNINTDVVFYSAGEVSRLRDRVRERELDGVYCRGRDDITSEILPIIDSTIRKVLDLENSRGLVMAELGELDSLMKDIIVSVHDSDDNNKAFIRNKLKTKVEAQARGIKKSLEGFDELSIAEIVETSLDSNKRLTSMISIAKQLQLVDFAPRLKSYIESVLFPRNCFGHGVPEEQSDGSYLFRHGNKRFLFSEETNAELRNNLRAFGTCLHEFQSAILAVSNSN